jgi:hypothetical protein
MCGDSMDHSVWAGHCPVSMHDYYAGLSDPKRDSGNDKNESEYL